MFRFPTGGVPGFDTLLDDLPTRDARRIARHLGVSTRTLARWKADGNPPRLAYIALFWETRWGVATINCEAINEAATAYGLARSLQARVEQLQARVAYLVGLAAYGCANEPLWDPEGTPPASARPAGGRQEVCL